MNLYSDEELKYLEGIKEKNLKYEALFEKEREDWKSKIDPLFKALSKNSTNLSAGDVMEAQSYSLSYRQILNDTITKYMNARAKEVVRLKKLKQEKFIYYSVGFAMKTNNSEKAILIAGHVGEVERTIDILDSHIDYLRESIKILDSFGYSIKYLIDLMNYLK